MYVPAFSALTAALGMFMAADYKDISLFFVNGKCCLFRRNGPIRWIVRCPKQQCIVRVPMCNEVRYRVCLETTTNASDKYMYRRGWYATSKFVTGRWILHGRMAKNGRPLHVMNGILSYFVRLHWTLCLLKSTAESCMCMYVFKRRVSSV